MLYYYHLFRFHVSNQYHIRNRANLDKSWKDLLEKRRKLRVISSQKSMFEKIKDYSFKK
jgi:hypothetical protein